MFQTVNTATPISLAVKYNLPVPRYTSYPAVPDWNSSIDASGWSDHFREAFSKQHPRNGLSLYLHLPFCESLCTYCGCNKKITTNHDVEDPYIKALLEEWKIYRDLMSEVPVIRECHLGGGTPTFFSPAHLEHLLHAIFNLAVVPKHHEFSFEGHPNNTTSDHLAVLKAAGFRRVSYGIQDLDPVVQRTINRIQPFENVVRVTEEARRQGYRSINFDLIYGLPRQTEKSLKKTLKTALSLRPDRIAFYSYAHVPWTSRAQRLFDEHDLPDPETKLRLYETGKQIFLKHGYQEIGMDHFALPGDDLSLARQEGRLHRNFMGYTPLPSALLLGLGVSSISDTGFGYAQNAKSLLEYYAAVATGKPAVVKGYYSQQEEQTIRKHIQQIICHGHTSLDRQALSAIHPNWLERLSPLEADGLVNSEGNNITVTAAGFSFLRNICAAIDPRFEPNNKPVYSKAV
ncbi:oxygen-independent coproporphyrinogen III oxidase [Flavihumibacter petaseus]|uniref:Coproporphyrinogen-III oxidase n=1 Tax=Flavihumibacter petaseus NBRC 106054 TaxID=1220578 RepID=A0A0E9N5C2_9BACT|nr:oxygen-independent coproporphyrinogen III oxidase [Flavihumibacter petaseus]GAO45167.1 oxygen-independent coproporphyrinogen III oxidase [Flavihumibacter petaseus NBRC 106054]